MESGISTFRVRPDPKPQPQPISSQSELGQNRIVHSRKAHNKSRGGCLACRQRRKKCDKKKPSCSRCLVKKLDCIYVAPRRKQSQPGPDKPNTPSVPIPIWQVAYSVPVLTTSNLGQHTCHDLVLLDYFIKHVGIPITDAELSRQLFTVQVVEIAKEVPFLMHAILAFAACQMIHTVPDGRPYRLPEALHAQSATQGLRQAVGHMEAAKDMDAVLGCAMLLNCLAFCYADWKEDEEITRRTRPSWQWLRIMNGVKDLIMETKPFHRDSMWLPMFISIDNFVIDEPSYGDLDVRLAEFCGINSNSNSVNNPYFEFHEQLAPLVVREPKFKNLRKYNHAIGGINHRFLDLCEEEDSKAMLLFAHWLALMCSSVSPIAWWVTKRPSRECWLICRILDYRLVGEDRTLLERPAMACGYLLDPKMPLMSPHYIPSSLRAFQHKKSPLYIDFRGNLENIY